MNWEVFEGKFMQFEGAIREQWAKLSTDDVERIVGRREKLVGLIEERYGIAKEEAEREADEWWRSAHRKAPENSTYSPEQGLK
jgi:uncharacterized protein YjbJ (UPF0337 family)